MRLRPGSMITAAVFALSCTGCYHHRLLTYGQPGNVLPFPRRVNTGWAGGSGSVVPPGGAAQSQRCDNEIDRNGMHMVTISSNLGFEALTAVTFGGVSLARVQWSCAPNPTVEGSTPSGGSQGASAAPKPPPTAQFTSRTLTSSVWGVLQSDAVAPANPPPDGSQPAGAPTPANCNDYGMRQVKIGSPVNYFYSLATIATLGFVSPRKMSWQCKEAGNASH